MCVLEGVTIYVHLERKYMRMLVVSSTWTHKPAAQQGDLPPPDVGVTGVMQIDVPPTYIDAQAFLIRQLPRFPPREPSFLSQHVLFIVFPLSISPPTHAGKSSDRTLFPKQWSPQGPEGSGRVGHEGVYGSGGDDDAGSFTIVSSALWLQAQRESKSTQARPWRAK